MFIRPTPEDFASDEAIEAFAQRVWNTFTKREEPMTPRLTDRYTQALAYAAKIHADQTRKGDAGIPYISHLLAASSLALEAGGDEDEAIAALLHDAAEDQGGEARLVDIEERFGPRVAGIVRECSDSLTEDPKAKAAWRTRKTLHLMHLRDASPSAVLVSAADKLHNARCLVTDLALDGLSYLTNFNASGADIVWYYREMYTTLTARAAPLRLTSALGECVEEFEHLINSHESRRQARKDPHDPRQVAPPTHVAPRADKRGK